MTKLAANVFRRVRKNHGRCTIDSNFIGTGPVSLSQAGLCQTVLLHKARKLPLHSLNSRGLWFFRRDWRHQKDLVRSYSLDEFRTNPRSLLAEYRDHTGTVVVVAHRENSDWFWVQKGLQLYC